MRLVSILIVVGALVVAGAIFLVMPRLLRGNQPPAQAQVARLAAQDVLVAAHNLIAGSTLKAEDLRWQRWPEEALDPDFMVREKGADPMKQAVGFVVLRGIDPGQPVTAKRLLKPGETGFLAAALTPGRTAITIRIDTVSAAAGFILPEDHVDIMLHEHFPIAVSADVSAASQNLPQISTRDVASIIMRDVKVLAVNQSLQDIDSKPNPGASTATLEVSEEDAEKVEVASYLGTLSLVLRSHTLPANPATDTRPPAIEDFQASPYRAAILHQIESNLTTREGGAGAAGGGSLRIYRGTQLAGGQ